MEETVVAVNPLRLTIWSMGLEQNQYTQAAVRVVLKSLPVRLFHQIVALQLRILRKYLRQFPPVSHPLEVKHMGPLERGEKTDPGTAKTSVVPPNFRICA